jgi:hypothetical protein
MQVACQMSTVRPAFRRARNWLIILTLQLAIEKARGRQRVFR